MREKERARKKRRREGEKQKKGSHLFGLPKGFHKMLTLSVSMAVHCIMCYTVSSALCNILAAATINSPKTNVGS